MQSSYHLVIFDMHHKTQVELNVRLYSYFQPRSLAASVGNITFSQIFGSIARVSSDYSLLNYRTSFKRKSVLPTGAAYSIFSKYFYLQTYSLSCIHGEVLNCGEL
jgi:hypothetical protein